MATLDMILARLSPNFLLKTDELKKSLKIHEVPFRASLTRFSAGSNPTSSNPSTLYDRSRVPSLQPISRTISPLRGSAVSQALETRSARAFLIIPLIPDLYQ